MALGQEIGDFETRVTSWDYQEDFKSVAIVVDGTATGFGTVLGTLNCKLAPGAKSASCSWRSQAFLENGDIISGVGEGNWVESGKHQWRVRMTITLNDGRFIAAEGTLDLASRSFNGKILEWS